MADFHEYYTGSRVAPYLTIFIGGNHEASNHLFELYYGGWVAPNIYYLGAANIVRVGPLRIAGLSGIWKGYDYRKPHFERLPYNNSDMYGIYHVRELDTRKLLAVKSQVDIGLSHDWPQGIEWLGDYERLFRKRQDFKDDAEAGKLGNVAARQCLDRLRPNNWFSAHLHTRYVAVVEHGEYVPVRPTRGVQADERQSRDHEPRYVKLSPIQTPNLADQPQVSAWQNFHITAQQEDQKERDRILRDQLVRQQETNCVGAKEEPKYKFDETFKQVKTDDDLGREITSISKSEEIHNGHLPIASLDGCTHSRERSILKRPRDPSNSSNEDATKPVQPAATTINQKGSAVVRATSPKGALENTDAIDISMSSDDEAEQAEQPLVVAPEPAADEQEAENLTVPEVIMAELAQISSSFLPTKQNSQQEKIEVSPSLPLPGDITNKTTHFLALGKCAPYQDFLQLLEIESISQEPADPISRPYKLSYDPEWLAITRVFAPELNLNSSPNHPIPPHRGDAYYASRIAEEESWIDEHVVRPGLLTVPENFELTAPVHDPEVTVGPEEMPREYTNPQTSAFCALVGIENRFDFSEEEREGRRAEGPRPDGNWGGRRGGGAGRRGGGGRGGRRGGRGGRGGRGRGGGGGRGWR